MAYSDLIKHLYAQHGLRNLMLHETTDGSPLPSPPTFNVVWSVPTNTPDDPMPAIEASGGLEPCTLGEVIELCQRYSVSAKLHNLNGFACGWVKPSGEYSLG